MNRFHTKLTQKYPSYHNWHQTKHHNEIHWGVLVIFSFFISTLLLNPLELNLKKDNNNLLSNIVVQKKEAKAAYTPSPGSPLANKEHPRLFFTAKDLPALRDKLKTQYTTELQDFINALDAGFNDDIVAKSQSARSYDAMNYAFLYLVDPSQMAPTFTFGRTRSEYGNKAIAHGLVIANDVLAGKIVDDMPQHLKPINMPMALVYDWTYTILTLQEKQKLADAFIKSFSNRLVMPGLPLTSGGIYGLHQGPTGALAFWGDNIDDGVTGTYYRDWAQKLLDQLKIDWLDRVYPSLNYFYENSGWRESWSYDGYYFAHVIPFTSMLSSAIGQDYLYNTGYIRYHPLFVLYGLKPRPDDKGKYYFIKYGTDDGTQSVSDSVYNRFIYPIDIIAKSDPDMAGLAKWILDQGYSGSLNSKTYDYLFNHFIFNNKNIIPKSPYDLNLPIAQRFGSGQFIMRTGFQDPNSTNIQFWAPKFHFLPGGHPHYDFASFAIEKYGRLALDAGAGKSAPFVEGLKTHLLYSNRESMFHNTIAVYKPGEKDLYGFNYMDYHTRGLSESANKPTDPAYQDGGSNQVGELKAEELNTGNYNYINYNYSRAWDNTKVSYANREFIYLNPILSSSKEFVIVFDRVISVDPSYTKRWFLWTAFDPEANGTFTQEKAGKWVSNDSNIFKVTNNYKGGLDTYLGSHGRLFSKTLLPTSFKINKLGGPGHEFEDAEGKSLVQTPGTMTNGACDWIGCWHIEVESTTNQKDDLFLHVLEIGDSNTLTAMTPTSRIDAGNMVGTLIDDPTTPRIVLFSKDPTGATVSSATYTADYSSTLTGKHLLADITPGTYDVYKNGVKILTGIVSQAGKNTLSFESTGGSTFSIVKTGEAPPPTDIIPPSTTASPAGGIYDSAQTVTLAANESATIYYTLDGSTPTTASPVYASPIPIIQNTILKFFAVDTAGNQEPVKTENYTINLPAPSSYYVAPDGSDTNSGDVGSPFKTISKALSLVKAGETVYLRAGVYSELVNFPTAGISDTERITLKAYNQEAVTITQTGRVMNIGQPYITVEDIIFDANWGDDDALKIYSTASFAVLRGVEIRNTRRDAVDMAGPQGVLIENSKIHDAIWVDGVVRNDAHGIVTAGVKDFTIRGTEIYYVSGDAVQFQYGGWDNVMIEDSKLWNGPLPTPRGGAPAGVYPGENAVDTKYYLSDGRGRLTIRNVTAYGWKSDYLVNAAAFNLKHNVEVTLDGITTYDNDIAFRLRGPSPTYGGAWVTLKNALIYDSIRGVRYEDKIENLHIYNSTWGNNMAELFENAGGTGQGFEIKNNLFLAVSKPLEASDASNQAIDATAFKNTATHDYHLADNSPAIDKGITLAQVTIDRDGISRPQGNGYDAGAYEFKEQAQFKPSDLNQDTKVDQLDFDILKQNFNRIDKPKSDLNQDGIVDSRDLGIMMSEWSK